MSKVTYEVVEHNGGYAYKVGDVFSETFATHAAAYKAAGEAAERQRLADNTEAIQYQDAQGAWHNELAKGTDRPETEVEDDLPDTGEELPERAFPNLDRAPFGDLNRRA